ncbi:MAG: platelet-activating factor acetylhydrolase IB subunit [Planctomycetota bacterium]|nr:platelet-activating factor acetylhydrolase IB subunit [Planctomycetota bacterium]
MSHQRNFVMRGIVPLAILASLSLAGLAQVVSKNSATDPAPRPDKGWQDRHSKFVERIKKGDADLLFIGDSITQGWEGSGKGVWAEEFESKKAVNLGIGGDRTQHVLWRLENGEIDGIAPKAAVVMIGTNNLGANTNEEIVAGITSIVKKLNDKLPKTKVLLLGIFPRGEKADNPLRTRIMAINAEIAKLNNKKSVFYKNIGGQFLAEDGSLPKATMPDFLHLSSDAYETWADAIEDDLEDLMESK